MPKLLSSYLSTEKGFSLLEILLAMAIFGLALGPLLNCLNQGLAGVIQAGNTSLATELAAASLDKLESIHEEVYLGNLPPREVVPVEGYPSFTMVREARLEDTFERDGSRLKLFRVAVEINWTEKGRQEKVRLVSYLMGR